MIKKQISLVLIFLQILLVVSTAFTQHNQGGGVIGTDYDGPGSYFSEDPFADEQKDEKKSKVENAILEGIQLTAEPSENGTDSIISCYFIFRDNPSSYFFNTNLKEKTIVFEFNDAVQGVAPLTSQELKPLKGFRIETEKVNANEEIAGLKPDWHDIMKVTFFCEAIPVLSVKDEYSVISFSFKWSNDPEKQKELIVKEKKKPLIIAIISGSIAGLAGLGLGLFFGNEDESEEKKDLSISDLPIHPTKNR